MSIVPRSSRRCALALATCLISLFGVAAQAFATPTPFGPTSVWNAPLADDAPVDPASASMVNNLNGQLAATVPWIATTSYSSPIYTVPAGAATYPVVVDGRSSMFTNWDDAWNLTHIQLAAVPIPAGIRAADGTDGRVIIYQPSTDTLWELWQMRL